MVRVYSHPGQAGQTTLGGLFGGAGHYKPFCMRLPYSEPGTAREDDLQLPPAFKPEVFPVHHHHHHPVPDTQKVQERFKVPVTVGICKQCKRFYTPENGNGYDYEDLLNQKRRDEARYRQGGQQSSGNLRSANSDGFLNSQSYGTSGGFNEQLEDLSQALSRLQQSVAPDTADLPQSFSYPTSAQPGLDYSHSRRTWSAPNKDPLQDPFKRSAPSQSQSGYQPSFGSSEGQQRGRRGQQDRRSYLQDLEVQMEEQRRRKEREERDAGTDWWEKKKAPATEFKAPHPNQGSTASYYNNASQRKTRNKYNEQSSYDRPDPAEVRKRYEQELKEQMEIKKKLDEEKKRKEREEEERFERRLQEQQEKMAREFQEEQNKKKEKENAKRKKQEQIARRQEEIKREMDERKKEEELRRSDKRRSVSRHSARGDPPAAPPPSEVVRGSSPPIPTMRGRAEAGEVAEESGGTGRPVSPGVVDTLHSMRQNLERRKQSLQYEEEKLGGEWTGLAEL